MKWKFSSALTLCACSQALHVAAQTEEPAAPPPAYEVPATTPEEPATSPPTPAVQTPPELEPQSPYEPPPPEPAPAKIRRHDGFYLRGGIGAAGVTINRSTEGALYNVANTSSESSIAGVGGMFELSMGGTPWPGLVIAGTLLTHSLREPAIDYDGARQDVDLGGPLSFVLLGGSVDWYPNIERGFHIGGTLGLAAVVADSPAGSRFDKIGGGGAGLSLSVGHDWWVADEWSIGILGRITGGRVRGEDTVSTSAGELKGTENSNLAAVGLMFSVVYH